MSCPIKVLAAGEEELTREADGEGEARFRTGRSHAGLGRPVPSGTRGESTGMLHTERLACVGEQREGTYFDRIRR
jgi:hypothetical protein